MIFFRKGIKSKLLPLFVASLLLGCNNEEEKPAAEVILTNNSDFELTDKPISIERISFQQNENKDSYPLVLSATDTIPSQVLDKDGDGNWDELFFVADFTAGETKTLHLEWIEEQPDYEVKTSVRFGKREAIDEPVEPATEETLTATDVPKSLGFQKYQTDGPTWENEKVGFRHYLDGRNARDIFGKRTAQISPEDVGIGEGGVVEDNYHTMNDWGRDIFPVGNSVGLGGIALLVGDEVQRLGVTVDDTINNVEKTTFRIKDEGPVKSVLTFEYNGWEAAQNSYNVRETIEIWPGMYGFKNTVEVEGLTGEETLLVGLSNINNEKPLQEVEIGNWIALIAHDYQTYEREWLLGTAILLPKDIYNGYIEAPEEGDLVNSFLAKLNVKSGEDVSYYAIAGWELSPEENFEDAGYFQEYVEDLTRQLSAEIDVEVKSLNRE